MKRPPPRARVRVVSTHIYVAYLTLLMFCSILIKPKVYIGREKYPTMDNDLCCCYTDCSIKSKELIIFWSNSQNMMILDQTQLLYIYSKILANSIFNIYSNSNAYTCIKECTVSAHAQNLIKRKTPI